MTPPNKQPSITDADRAAAEKIYPKDYRPDIDYDINSNEREGFFRGILHERAKVDELVRAAKEARYTLSSYESAADWTSNDQKSLDELDNALKQFSGRSG